MDSFWSVTFPDWLVGLGTIGLAVLTYASLRRVIKQERQTQAEKSKLQQELDSQKLADIARQVEESERAARERRRAQAEQVVVWSESIAHEDVNYFDAAGLDLGFSEAAIVQNNSSLPITEVWIYWCSVGGSGVLESRPIPTVPPRAQRSYTRPWSLHQNPVLPVEVGFTDANGVTWKRTRDGKIHELGEANTPTAG